VQNLATMGWALFPGIHTVADDFNNLHFDTIALLGYDLEKQVRVVDKIRAFVGRIAHRTVVDIIRMQRSSELEDMWFTVDVPEQRRTKCEEVRHCPFTLIATFSCHSTYTVVLVSCHSFVIYLCVFDFCVFISVAF
jgi:hypothetical protein